MTNQQALIEIAREIEALKRPCGMDPESPIAIQNGRYMSLSYKVRELAALLEAQQPAPSAARPVTPYTCPKCHALWLHWPAEQTGFGRDTLNCRSADHCHYCEKAGVEQLQRLERVPAALTAPQPSPTPQADSQPAPDAWLVTGIYTKQAFPMHCSATAFLNGLLSSDPDGGYKIVPLFIHQQTTAGACGCEEPPTNPGDTESGPEGEWYCETHPGQLMGHAGCGGAGIPACGRIPCLMNQLRLTKQQVRETGRMRDEMAAAVLRAARAPEGSVTAASDGGVTGPEWKWVPVDATDAMVRATDKVNFENEDTDGTMHNVWNAMLAAAPKALDVGSLVTRESAIQAIEHVALSHSMGLEAIDMLAAAVAATDEADTVDLVGVRATGEHVDLGKIAMPPRMKAREIARSYFGHFEDEDGSDAELCFGALETLLDWLSKQGWEPNLKPIQGVHPAVSKTLVNQLLEALETSRVLKADYDSLENYGVASRKHAKAMADARAYVATPPAQAADSAPEDAARLERERICAAIKAEDDYCVDQGDYMLDSDDCIKIVRGEWVRPDFSVDAASKQGANHD